MWCIHSLPRQFNSFLLWAPAPCSSLFTHSDPPFMAVETLSVLRKRIFQSADWSSVRIKTVTLEPITRARIKSIFSLRLFQRLANPSLGYSSNCISSRLWPLGRNPHIFPCLHLVHSLYCWALRIGIWLSDKPSLHPLLENGKFLSVIISSEPRKSWLFIFLFLSTSECINRVGYFSWTFNFQKQGLELNAVLFKTLSIVCIYY